MSKGDLPPEQDKLAKEIAFTLKENVPWAKTLIRQIIQEVGDDFACQLLKEALQIDADGGMLTLDGVQKRTIGGIFFHLARNRLPQETVERVFARENRRRKHTPKYIDWDKRTWIIEERLQKKGKIREVHVSMIAKPKTFTRTYDTIVTQMIQLRQQKDFPNGLPPLPEQEPLYTVYIAAKHWEAVRNQLKRKDQWLKIEGEAFYDEAIPGISVLAMNVKLKTISKTDQNVPEMIEVEASDVTSGEFKSTEVTLPKQALEPTPQTDIQLQIETLQSALTQYEKRIADLEQDPENNRSTLKIIRRMLVNTQKQIADLARK